MIYESQEHCYTLDRYHYSVSSQASDRVSTFNEELQVKGLKQKMVIPGRPPLWWEFFLLGLMVAHSHSKQSKLIKWQTEAL